MQVRRHEMSSPSIVCLAPQTASPTMPVKVCNFAANAYEAARTVARTSELVKTQPLSQPTFMNVAFSSQLVLRNDLVNHVSGNIGQPKVTTAVTIRQFCMVDSQQIQNSGMDIVHVDGLLDGFPPEIVGRSKRHPALDSASSQPHCESMGIVIP